MYHKKQGSLQSEVGNCLTGAELFQETSRSSSKKSQIPVQLDLGGMLAVLEQKQQTEKAKQSPKPVVFSGIGYYEISFVSP